MGGCVKSRNQIADDVLLSKHERLRLENFTSKTNIRDVYTFSSVLGKGGFGTVKLAALKNGVSDKKVAVKIIEKNRLKNKQYILLRELEILRSLDHPNIIKFYEVYQDEMFFYICMEYCAGGELLDRITKARNFREQDAALIMGKIFSAINHMHSQGIVHRDIKPENILFVSKSPDSEIKIIDFGLSVKCDGMKDLSTMVGTPLYVSPNVLRGRYDNSSDNWSAGVILYVLLVGYPPFYGKSRGEVFRKIEKGVYNIEGKEWDTVSSEAKDLVRKLLVVDSNKRMTAAQALKHKWIVKHKKIQEWTQFKNFSTIGSMDQIDPKILAMLQNFRQPSKFKNEVMKILINQLNEKEIEQLKFAFKQMDTEQTGEIGIDQLQEVMEQNGYKQTKEQLEKIIRSISSNQDGKDLVIRYSEFLAATLDSVVYLKSEKIWSLFKYFDPSNSNFITIQDLKEIFLRNGRNLPEEELKQMVKEVDPNNDGKISLEEFKLLMKGEDIDFKS